MVFNLSLIQEGWERRQENGSRASNLHASNLHPPMLVRVANLFLQPAVTAAVSAATAATAATADSILSYSTSKAISCTEVELPMLTTNGKVVV